MEDNSNAQRSETQDLDALKEFYTRFSHFMRTRRIERDEFCRNIHFVLPMDEFQECCKRVNFPITNEEIY